LEQKPLIANGPIFSQNLAKESRQLLGLGFIIWNLYDIQEQYLFDIIEIYLTENIM